MPQELQTQPTQEPAQPAQPYQAHEIQPASPPGPDALTVLDNHAMAFAVVVVALVALAFYRPFSRLIESMGQRKFKIGNLDVGAPGEQQVLSEAGAVTKKPEFQIITGNTAMDSVRDWLSEKLQEFPESERPGRLLGLTTDLYIRADFFRAYLSIYGSQLSLLRIANMSGGAVTHDVAKRTFEETLARAPENGHPFKEVDQWLEYLKRCAFVETSDHAVALTPRGKLFLHFMVEEGLSDLGLIQNLAGL